MSALNTYLEGTDGKRGLGFIKALRVLRLYVRQCTEAELIDAIGRITRYDHLRVMMAVGLSGRLQQEILNQAARLMERGAK